jgi:hypothetical protein
VKQATTPDGLKRWYVFTDQGRRVTWAKDEHEAQAKAEKRGRVVESVEPAPSLLDSLKGGAA